MAMVGLRIPASACSAAATCSLYERALAAFPRTSWNSLMSAPEANALRPAPRTTSTLIAESAPICPSRRGSSSYMPRRIALWLSGRFNTKVATAPERSTTRSSDIYVAPMQFRVLVVGDAVGVQPLDLVVVIADLPQHVGGVLPEPRGGPADLVRQIAELRRRGYRAHQPDDGMPDLGDHVTGGHVRVVESLVVGEDRPAGHTGRPQHLDPVRGGLGRRDGLDLALQLVDGGHAIGEGDEPGIVEPLRPLEDVEHQALPQPVVVGADRHIAVRRAVRLVRRRPAMPGAGLRGHLAVSEVRAGLPDRPGQRGVHQRDVHVLALAAVATDHLGGEDRIDRGRAGREVGDGDAHLGGTATGLPGHPHEAGHALRHDVEAGPVAVRAGLAETADGAVEDVRSYVPYGLVADPEAVHHAGTEVLDDQVAVPRHPQKGGPATGVLEVHRHAALAAVGHRERVALAVDLGGESSRIVPGAGLFQLDDVGPQLGENHRAIGPGQEAGEIQNLEPLERKPVIRKHCQPSRIMECCTALQKT